MEDHCLRFTERPFTNGPERASHVAGGSRTHFWEFQFQESGERPILTAERKIDYLKAPDTCSLISVILSSAVTNHKVTEEHEP